MMEPMCIFVEASVHVFINIRRRAIVFVMMEQQFKPMDSVHPRHAFDQGRQTTWLAQASAFALMSTVHAIQSSMGRIARNLNLTVDLSKSSLRAKKPAFP